MEYPLRMFLHFWSVQRTHTSTTLYTTCTVYVYNVLWFCGNQYCCTGSNCDSKRSACQWVNILWFWKTVNWLTLLANTWFNQIRLVCILYFERALCVCRSNQQHIYSTFVQCWNRVFQFSQIINTISIAKFDSVKFHFSSLTQLTLSMHRRMTCFINYVTDWISFRWWEKMKHANEICKWIRQSAWIWGI